MHPADPPSGWVADGVHHFPIRVYFEDTDAGGVVYHATYLRFAERARTEFLRISGVPHHDLIHDEALVFVVRSVAVEYLSPARLDDSLLVETRAFELGAASVALHQRVLRGADALSRIAVTLASVSTTDGRPRRIPRRWREALVPPDGQASGARSRRRKEL
jgi:acyl-CoA thioester hydrolase